MDKTLPPIGQLFKESWATFTQSILSLFLLNILGIVIWVALAIIGVLIFILSGAGSALLKNGLQGFITGLQTNPSAAVTTISVLTLVSIIIILVSIIIGSALQIASILIVDKSGKIPVGESVRKSFAFIISLFLVGILTFILTFGAFFVLFLPAVLFYFLLAFTQFEVILNNQRWLGAVKRSVTLVSRHFGAILIRLILLFLIYVLYMVIVNLVGKAGPDTEALMSIVSFFINLLLGWFSLAYFITLYKQARLGMENVPGKGIGWMWLIAILGWIIAIAMGFVTYKTISSGILNELYKKSLPATSPQTSVDLVSDANSKIEEAIKIQNKGNLTSVDHQQIINLTTSAISEYTQATQENPMNTNAWSNLAALNKRLGDVLGNDPQNPNQIMFYSNAAKAYLDLGNAYMQLGDKQKAKEAFEQALSIVPKSATTLKLGIEKALREI